jgi:predicted ATP-dependent protease
VIDAVRAGRFSIYAVSTIDEGIEILTGIPAGERDDHNAFKEGTVNHRVEQRLKEFAEGMRKFAEEEKGVGKKE